MLALVLSRTLQAVARDIGDGQLMLYAYDMERSARELTEFYLSFGESDDTAH